ncbi:MAG: HupE/UreJ family protein [Rhodoferax sp.]|nr:HupE/UreJ family protein [Rhodoferax sp.]
MKSSFFAAQGVGRLLALTLFVVGAGAQAHTGQETTAGFISGFLHPVTGFDHLLAMVAVGIWGGTLGRPLIWALPVAFPLLMVVGGVLGIVGVPVPLVETGVAVSVVVLGVAIALAWRALVAVAFLIVAAFGIFHGYAHGAELPNAVSPVAYVVGFVLCTVLLHPAGIAIGMLGLLRGGTTALRAGGALISASGRWILTGLPGVA